MGHPQRLTDDPGSPLRPPTQDELPYDDGEPMESDRHLDQMNLLIDVLRQHFQDRPDVFVGGNMGIYYSMLGGPQCRAPDVFVALDAIPRAERDRKSWVIWEEGVPPSVVMELLSPSTRRADQGLKKQIYERRVRAAEYFLYDLEERAMEGFRLDGGRYVPLLPLPNGELESRELGLRLGVVESSWQGLFRPWLRWKTTDGKLLPTTGETAEAEKNRAEAEKNRANTAEERARLLADRLRSLGIDPA